VCAPMRQDCQLGEQSFVLTTRKQSARFLLIAAFLCLNHQVSRAQQTERPFTVADEIDLTLFGHPNGQPTEVHFSPDENYFAVWTERGRLDLNLVEDSLRFYRTKDIKSFLERSDEAEAPSPVWIVNRSDKEGPTIRDWRWLADSSGVAFLEGAGDWGDKRLVLADLRKKTVEQLTSASENVQMFDIRDRQHYVYTSADAALQEKWRAERRAPAIFGTGLSIYDLLFPDDPLTVRDLLHASNYLWAVAGDKRFEVKRDGSPIVPDGSLALSPDGSSLVSKLPVPEFPSSWEALYPPPFPSDYVRIRASNQSSVRQYVQITLQTGAVQSLTDAPTSDDAGWWASGNPSWSSDGQAILLPGTFLSSKDHAPSRPCVAVVDVSSTARECVEMLKATTETGFEEGYHRIRAASFLNENKHRVAVTFSVPEDQTIQTVEYEHTLDGTWHVAEQIKGDVDERRNGLEVNAKQWFNVPAQLTATYKQISRVIWDPNPQLKDIALGDASIYRWKDKEGREWKGGLYKPSNYKPGQRYPMVIQTHGFPESEFRPSGVFPTGMAARALAAGGIVVLQVQENCPLETPSEGPCAVSGYEAAVNHLVSEGLVDPEKIGIIGFSRTCFYVMETLTFGALHFKAASITDGIMGGYPEYMFFDQVTKTSDSLIGAKPFGEGLQQWLKRSPGFNLEKVNTSLLVVGDGPASLLWMWEPYAGLRYLHKSVDLIVLNTHEHVLTNPAVRMASQGGSVDWFRFWLQDYEDSNPTKAEQYKRWRELRKVQADEERMATTPQRVSD
jgi:dipeptidyl aminopeptidase/acylaminoacyl peptidase